MMHLVKTNLSFLDALGMALQNDGAAVCQVEGKRAIVVVDIRSRERKPPLGSCWFILNIDVKGAGTWAGLEALRLRDLLKRLLSWEIPLEGERWLWTDRLDWLQW